VENISHKIAANMSPGLFYLIGCVSKDVGVLVYDHIRKGESLATPIL
jgi:hypothetical protein